MTMCLWLHSGGSEGSISSSGSECESGVGCRWETIGLSEGDVWGSVMGVWVLWIA